MEESLTYNAIFWQLVAVFSKFLISVGQDSLYVNTRMPDGYLSTMYMDYELTTYSLTKDARVFIIHLAGAICGCTFCVDVAQLSTQIHCARCCLDPSCICSKPSSPIIPVDFTSMRGEHTVSRISSESVYRFLNLLTEYNTTNVHQDELRQELIELLNASLRIG